MLRLLLRGPSVGSLLGQQRHGLMEVRQRLIEVSVESRHLFARLLGRGPQGF